MKKYELAKLQHKANNWDTFLKWIIFPGLVMSVMLLCGFIDAM